MYILNRMIRKKTATNLLVFTKEIPETRKTIEFLSISQESSTESKGEDRQGHFTRKALEKKTAIISTPWIPN